MRSQSSTNQRQAMNGPHLGSQPNREFALDSYRALAADYDASCRLIEPVRRHAIALLHLQPGQTVIDVASGTGKSLPALAAAVGPRGRVIAVEQSPEMVEIANRRIAELGLANVEQLLAPVEEARIDGLADAVLLHYTHDVLRTPAALRRLFAAVRPQATVVVAGYKFATGWRSVFNPWFKARARGYLSTFEGAAAPWSHLIEHVPDFRIHKEYFLGSGYLGHGHLCKRPDLPSTDKIPTRDHHASAPL
jgi:ubiquinone/menaquinone biosynthesis C-methylase UbiE